jgi:CheY-like chemotaxis protein
MQNKRLLICDDEPAFGRFVKNVAEDLGYEVELTTDGRAFIEAYGGFKPTTIVLDMIMPGMDGNELVPWLADKACAARLIIMTGYTPDSCQAARGIQGASAGDNVEQANRTQRATGHPSGGIGTNPAVGNAGVRSI